MLPRSFSSFSRLSLPFSLFIPLSLLSFFFFLFSFLYISTRPMTHFHMSESEPVYIMQLNRSFSLSRNKKINRKLASGKKLRNCDVIEDETIRHFSKFQPCAFPQTSDIRRNVAQKFTEPSKRHVGVPPWYTNMAAGKWGKHLELTLAF